MPDRNSHIISVKMPSGRMPAVSSFSFSLVGTWRSSAGSAGPSDGLIRQRT